MPSNIPHTGNNVQIAYELVVKVFGKRSSDVLIYALFEIGTTIVSLLPLLGFYRLTYLIQVSTSQDRLDYSIIGNVLSSIMIMGILESYAMMFLLFIVLKLFVGAIAI